MQFKDIAGQTVVANRLIQIVDSGRMPHAQLFVGDMERGGLALALAMAQYAECSNRQHYAEADPAHELIGDSCGQCDNCLKYGQLTHSDLHFIFPTSSTDRVKDGSELRSESFMSEFREFMKQYHMCGTYEQWHELAGFSNVKGQIRKADADDIERQLHLTTYQRGYRVFIIWLADRINDAVAVRLLKPIEEPVGNTLFLLLAEQEEKVIGTIRSRTQRILVPPPTSALAPTSEAQERSKRYTSMFVEWMRMLFKLNMAALSEWVNSAADMRRDFQREFLLYAQDSIGACFLAQQTGQPLARDFGDAKFNASFPTILTERNIAGINEAFDHFIMAVDRNAYSKITLMELSFTLSRLLKKR